MKKLTFLLVVGLLLLSCKSKKAKTIAKESRRYDTISQAKYSEVKSIKTNRAYELGKRLMETCNTSKFRSFNSGEATESVIKNATVEKISKTCQRINSRNGKFLI